MKTKTLKLKFGLETWIVLKTEIIGYSESNTNTITQIILKGGMMLCVDLSQNPEQEKDLKEFLNQQPNKEE